MKPDYKQIARIERLKTHSKDFNTAFKMIWGWIRQDVVTMKQAEELVLVAHKLCEEEGT
jgi:hypothetical protein